MSPSLPDGLIVRRAPTVRLLLVLVLVAATLVACRDEGRQAPPPTTTEPRTTTTLSQEQQDEQALRQLADDWFEAVRRILTREAQVDLAEGFLTDRYLSTFRDQMADLEASGQSVEADPAGRSTNTTKSVVIDGDDAELIECIIDGDLLMDANGNVLNGEVTARTVRTTAVRTADGWRFSDRTGITEHVGSSVCTES